MENTTVKKKALFVLDEFKKLYNDEVVEKIKELVDVYAEPLSCADIEKNPEILNDCEIISVDGAHQRWMRHF